MGNATRIDPPEVRRIGGVFGEAARTVDVACTGLGECDFGARLGRRYAHHELAYSAGLLAMAQSVRALAQSTRQLGEGLVGAADTLGGQDAMNADVFGTGEVGRG